MAKSAVDRRSGSPVERSDGTLALDRETMRELGYRTVDMLVERLGDGDVPPLRRGSARGDGRAPRRRRRPRIPRRSTRSWSGSRMTCSPSRAACDHPGFFAFIPSCGTWPSALADFVASACNIYAGSWMESAGPSQLELEVLGWFKSWVGYPETAEGPS